MNYTVDEILQYVEEEDVKFIRIAFVDVFGKQKNIAIMPHELERAFKYGVAIDASSISGFSDEAHSDLLLFPDADTITILPWRPEHGKVVRMFCKIVYPDGRDFECDSRQILINAINTAKEKGLTFFFGAEQEFYLFKLDENGNKTTITYDKAGYMDIAPDDKGENIRREICLTLEQMGILPESSHHEAGPGQNEIDFRYSDALSAADNVITFQSIVRTTAFKNGLYASFAPKPLKDQPGNGFHVNISVKSTDGKDYQDNIVSGILHRIKDMTLFMNASEESYQRLGKDKAPKYISYSHENRSQLIRIPAASGEYKRVELRSPDPSSNPYLAFALIIYACIESIELNLPIMEENNENLYTSRPSNLATLPLSLKDAIKCAERSEFIQKYLPSQILSIYTK